MNLSSAELAQGVVKVKQIFPSPQADDDNFLSINYFILLLLLLPMGSL